MEKAKLERINFLARKSRTEKLTHAELEHTVIERPDGTREPLPKKKQ